MIINNSIRTPAIAEWARDYDSTRKDIERMETEAQTHENPFADHRAAQPPFPVSPENGKEALGKLAAPGVGRYGRRTSMR